MGNKRASVGFYQYQGDIKIASYARMTTSDWTVIITAPQVVSEEMLKGGEGVAEEMQKLDGLTRVIIESMNAMVSGAIQINNAVQGSQRNNTKEEAEH